MTKYFNIYPAILAAVLFSCSFSASAKDFVVIVNKLNPIETLSKSDVKKYFFKDLVLWNDGVKVMPLDYADTYPLVSSFSLDVLMMDPVKKKHIMISNEFSGKSTPPLQLATENEVINTVARELGAIGYVSTSSNISKVKVVQLQ